MGQREDREGRSTYDYYGSVGNYSSFQPYLCCFTGTDTLPARVRDLGGGGKV